MAVVLVSTWFALRQSTFLPCFVSFWCQLLLITVLDFGIHLSIQLPTSLILKLESSMTFFQFLQLLFLHDNSGLLRRNLVQLILPVALTLK